MNRVKGKGNETRRTASVLKQDPNTKKVQKKARLIWLKTKMPDLKTAKVHGQYGFGVQCTFIYVAQTQ